jgi:hypothetical protein
MKIDASSIFYIVISILILVVTGLSRRKKKPIVPKPGLQNMQGQAPGVSPDAATSGREDRISDPFERLERMFIQPEADTYSEAVSLEELVNEETEYLKEKEAASETAQVEQEIPKEPSPQELIPSQEKEKKYQKLDLFKCVNDLKKAVIYAEILNRKEY